ncbi:hypothetical protein TIFTF001_054051 [Ficus carica]|uniref:Uncharacterized protein n=1 Tax=Ficus carica TaxID=3494 RepID=A0AA88JGA1_FICCA|nr:hypothetical protein TIFTF001_054051 [Ficus carica]
MVSVADRYRSKAGVSCEGRGLVQETHAGTGFTTRIQVLGALHRPSIWPVLARTGESEHGRRIGQQSFRRGVPLCHVSLVSRAVGATCTPPRAGRQSDTSNFEISNFELEWGVGGKSNRRLENRTRVLRPTLAPINSEGYSALSTIAYEDSSFYRELPKTAEDYQAKDLEDQCRQLPRR